MAITGYFDTYYTPVKKCSNKTSFPCDYCGSSNIHSCNVEEGQRFCFNRNDYELKGDRTRMASIVVFCHNCKSSYFFQEGKISEVGNFNPGIEEKFKHYIKYGRIPSGFGVQYATDNFITTATPQDVVSNIVVNSIGTE